MTYKRIQSLMFNPTTRMHDSPVTQMRLDGKQVLIKTLNGFFLKYKVNPSPAIQHSHFNFRLLHLLC